MSTLKKLTPQEQEILGQAINTALEMELAFKLYSFRVATPEQFMARVGDLAEYYLKQLKDGNGEKSE